MTLAAVAEYPVESCSAEIESGIRVFDFPTRQCCTGCRLKDVLVDLRWRSGYWETQFKRASIREAEAKQQVEAAKARIRYLEQQLYGSKSEQHFSGERESREKKEHRPRGQQVGSSGHSRRHHEQLAIREKVVDLEENACPKCGKPYRPFEGTEDSDEVVMEVSAHRRRYRRRRYTAQCDCAINRGIITAPVPAKLIPKSGIDKSVWIHILVEKYLYQRPINRILSSLCEYGIDLAAGTVSDGLMRLAPLFEVFAEPIQEKSLQERWWHADETRWTVMELIEGKHSFRWWIWVFVSQSTIVYVLAPGRDAGVVKGYFDGAKGGFLCVDRYSSYKCFVKAHNGFILVFCWAHVRRDFLDAGKSWPQLEAWSLRWVNRIAELYHLNKQRLSHKVGTRLFRLADGTLRQAMQKMRRQRDAELEDTSLHPACRKVLTSLVNHWKGLTVFLDNPHIPMDNNTAERAQRNNAVGRKNYYGSGSVASGYFTVTMFTVLQTLKLWGINVRTWMSDYLLLCANNGGNAPADISTFLPWNMPAKVLQRYRMPPHNLASDSS